MRTYRIAAMLLEAGVVYLIRLFVLGAAAALYVYFLPSLIAEKRKLPKTQAIFVLNLAAGWMIVPWVVALVLAYKMEALPQSAA